MVDVWVADHQEIDTFYPMLEQELNRFSIGACVENDVLALRRLQQGAVSLADIKKPQ